EPPRVPSVQIRELPGHQLRIGQAGRSVVLGIARDRAGLLDRGREAGFMQVGGAGTALALAEVHGHCDAAVVGGLHRLHLAHAHGYIEPALFAAAHLRLAGAQRAGARQQPLRDVRQPVQPLLAVVIARDVVHVWHLGRIRLFDIEAGNADSPRAGGGDARRCRRRTGDDTALAGRRRALRLAEPMPAGQFIPVRVESRPSERATTPCADATKTPANFFPPAAASSAARPWACSSWPKSWPASLPPSCPSCRSPTTCCRTWSRPARSPPTSPASASWPSWPSRCGARMTRPWMRSAMRWTRTAMPPAARSRCCTGSRPGARA